MNGYCTKHSGFVYGRMVETQDQHCWVRVGVRSMQLTRRILLSNYSHSSWTIMNCDAFAYIVAAFVSDHLKLRRSLLRSFSQGLVLSIGPLTFAKRSNCVYCNHTGLQGRYPFLHCEECRTTSLVSLVTLNSAVTMRPSPLMQANELTMFSARSPSTLISPTL